MIDFSTVKSMVIPEGEVLKVMRGSEVLWEKVTKKYKTELVYIKSTGTQWINTEYIPSTETKVEIRIGGIDENTFPVGSGGWFIGSRTSYNDRGFGTYYNPAENNLYGAFGKQQLAYKEQKTNFYNKDHTIVIDKSGLYLDGAKKLTFNNSFEGQYPLYLFTINLAGSLANLMSFSLYGLRIWQNGELVREYIPVIDYNDTPCLFDKVNEKFYYNAGIGSFKYAELIDEEYESIEYLESTGREFIDTEMNISTSTDTVECVYQSLEDVKYKWIFGEHDTNARFGVGTGDGSGQRNVAYGTGTAKVADSYIFNNPHTLLADTTGVYIDGTKITSYKAFTSTSTIYLFNLNLNGTNYCNKARIYSYRHWRDGKLVREMIPVKRLLDGEAGLYDKANKVFYPLFTTFNLRREPTEEEMYQIWLEDIGHEEEIL